MDLDRFGDHVMTGKAIPPREAEAIDLLGRKVSAEGYLVIPQVGNGTGANARRTADGLMVQTWPSRRLSITGIEYKRDRSDWRRELRDGQKAETVAAYCHYWIVLAPQGVVPIEEIPAGWGLWEFTPGRRLLRTKPPPPQDDVKPLNYSFLAAVLRAADKAKRTDAALTNERQAMAEQMEEKIEAAVKARAYRFEDLEGKVKKFEEASGLDISRGWGLDKLGAGVADFLEDPDRFSQLLKTNRRGLVHILAAIDKALEK